MLHIIPPRETTNGMTVIGPPVAAQALRQIAYAARNRCPIDVVLYVDRMDMPRVEDLDCEVRGRTGQPQRS